MLLPLDLPVAERRSNRFPLRLTLVLTATVIDAGSANIGQMGDFRPVDGGLPA
jgi:hypothetical protein